MNIFLSSPPNMIIDSASRWVGNRFVGGSVVHGFNKTQEIKMFGVVISPVHFGRGSFCYSNFDFF